MKNTTRNATTCILWACLCVHASAFMACDPRKSGPLHELLGEMMVLDSELRLREKGYEPADLESIKKATADDSYPTRACAVRLLAARIGTDSTPVLRKALDDSSQMVRCSAAALLAVFGDRAGLTRMRADLIGHTPTTSVGEIDRAVGMDDRQKRQARRRRTRRLTDALDAATVLADFGDDSGYDLAVKVLRDSAEYPMHRGRAVQVLSHLSNAAPDQSRVQKDAPDDIVLALAATEKDLFVIHALKGYANVRRRLEVGVEILEALAKSPHVSGDCRVTIERSLKYRRQDLERAKEPTPED